MKRTRIAMLLALALVLGGAIAAQADVSITYWQYFYESKVNLMNDLIQKFEAQNPGITVEQVTFPYESYQQKVAAAIPAGEGPDIINLFYGWLPLWVKSGYLEPLPASDFSSAYFAKSFYPFVAQSVSIGGQELRRADRGSKPRPDLQQEALPRSGPGPQQPAQDAR